MTSVNRRARSSTFRYKDLAEAQASGVELRASRAVSFNETITTLRPFPSITVAGGCQGWRKSMEDCQRLTAFPFGVLLLVLDGHRGMGAARFCAEALPAAISARAAPIPPPSAISALGEWAERTPPVEALRRALCGAFVDVDARLLEAQGGRGAFPPNGAAESAGATAVAVLADAAHISVANLGDCRAFLVERRPKYTERAETKSAETKEVEMDCPGARVTAATETHRVRHGRLAGALMVTRAFGDFDLKLRASGVALRNVPHVRVWRRAEIPKNDGGDVVSYDLVVAGSDGTWERQNIAHIATRADGKLQPILRTRPPVEADAEAQKGFMQSVEKALRDVITETLQKGIALGCSPRGITPGGDNMSLGLLLLLGE